MARTWRLGYSGAGSGKNNPDDRGRAQRRPHTPWRLTVVGPPISTAEHGQYVLTLKPSADTPTFGRDGFLLHGDFKESPGCASDGCVIMPRSVRELVWKSGDRDLEVVAEIATQDPVAGEANR